MRVSISIFGLGYVGLRECSVFCAHGHRVMGVDVDPTKVEDAGARGAARLLRLEWTR